MVHSAIRDPLWEALVVATPAARKQIIKTWLRDTNSGRTIRRAFVTVALRSVAGGLAVGLILGWLLH